MPITAEAAAAPSEKNAALPKACLFLCFFAKRKLWFKVLAAFLWFPVAGISLAVGMIGFFPYWVYNLVRIIIGKPEEKPEEENG